MLNRLQDVFKSFQQHEVASKRASGRQVNLDDVSLLELPDQDETSV